MFKSVKPFHLWLLAWYSRYDVFVVFILILIILIIIVRGCFALMNVFEIFLFSHKNRILGHKRQIWNHFMNIFLKHSSQMKPKKQKEKRILHKPRQLQLLLLQVLKKIVQMMMMMITTFQEKEIKLLQQ